MTDQRREYSRLMLRSMFQSLFWNVLMARKRQFGFTFSTLADKLGINKSYISRSFSSPPNWQIDKIADMADALNIELVVVAHDKADGTIYSANGFTPPSVTYNLVPSAPSGADGRPEVVQSKPVPMVA